MFTKLDSQSLCIYLELLSMKCVGKSITLQIHGKMYELNFTYDIHYICYMTLTCNSASHCICTGTSHFMGMSAWLKSSTTLVIDEWARYQSRNVT